MRAASPGAHRHRVRRVVGGGGRLGRLSAGRALTDSGRRHGAAAAAAHHAALEKLVSPYKSITAHVLQAPAAIETIEDVDAWLAASLSAERLVPKPFAPLPLLGVPGWWAPNDDAAFYDDARVFRPLRT